MCVVRSFIVTCLLRVWTSPGTEGAMERESRGGAQAKVLQYLRRIEHTAHYNLGSNPHRVRLSPRCHVVAGLLAFGEFVQGPCGL